MTKTTQTSTREKVYKQLADLLRSYDYNSIFISENKNFVSLDIEGAYLTFDNLSKISELFGTKNINIKSRNGDQGCDTCGYGANSIIEIEIEDITKWPDLST